MSIIIFGKPSCAPCATLKYYLDKKGFTYKYIEGEVLALYPKAIIDGVEFLGLPSILNRLRSLT